MRFVTMLALSMALSGCSQAAEQPAADATATAAGAPPAGGPPPMGDPKDNPDMTGFAAEVDTDKDGKLSLAEWNAKGLPSSSFNMFEKDRGYVTLRDYQVNAAPAGIDINGDGKVTVAEFLEFDKEMSASMPAGGRPPQGAPAGGPAPKNPAGE